MCMEIEIEGNRPNTKCPYPEVLHPAFVRLFLHIPGGKSHVPFIISTNSIKLTVHKR